MASSLSNSNDSPSLEVIFIPWYATGHLIPLVDIASLFANRGVSSTILTTPANAALIQPTIDHLSTSSSLPIQTLLYPFPSSESNLPPNAENIASVPPSESFKFEAASVHSRPAIESLLRLRRPNAIVADIHFTWIFETARELHIPFLVFHAIGLFPVSVVRVLEHEKPQLSVSSSDNDKQSITPFLVPGLPHKIHLVPSEIPNINFKVSPWDKMEEMEASSLGVVVNSFAEIESGYADYRLNAQCVRSWFVGPVALATANIGRKQNELMVSRGGGEESSSTSCMSWLDSQQPKSVVYVCFGSWCHFEERQIRELASGLEMCGHRFLWVVRGDSVGFLPEGFEGRVETTNRGLVVRGWAPQAAVLGHAAVGGFVTHCGWNSLMEGLAAGLPMVTWPLVFEQFINEKLVTEVLRTGVKCRRGNWSVAEEEKEVVAAEEVATEVGRMMASEEGEEMRKRAEELAVKAEEAVKQGGPSYNGLTDLIQELNGLAQIK